MPRRPRIQFAGAAYHIMNRGDQGDDVFRDDLDYRNFLKLLGDCSGRTGWRVHSYVLMPNHFHMLVETPSANLVAGMKWFMGAYTQSFNRRHGLHGHAFQGRYKAVLVQKGKGEYFETVSTYIHLNPARGGFLSKESPELAEYAWSSYPAYVGKTARPEWLAVDRVLGNLGWEDDALGRRRYQEYMARRVGELRTKRGRRQYQQAWKPVRFGWCVGDDGFEQSLLQGVKDVVEKGRRESYSGAALVRHEEEKAEKLIAEGLRAMKVGEDELAGLSRGSVEKGLIAWQIQAATTLSQRWIAERLSMGAPSNVGTYTRRAFASKTRRAVELRRKLLE